MRLGLMGIIAVTIPALEIVGIYLVGSRIGLWPTLLWLLTTVIAGAYVIGQERATFMPRLHQVMSQGQPPFALLWASGRRFLAGVLLIVPGPLSDLIALPLLLWPRPKVMPPPTESSGPARSETTPKPKPSAVMGDVIEGEFRRED